MVMSPRRAHCSMSESKGKGPHLLQWPGALQEVWEMPTPTLLSGRLWPWALRAPVKTALHAEHRWLALCHLTGQKSKIKNDSV